jgi:hypothetical protein
MGTVAFTATSSSHATICIFIALLITFYEVRTLTTVTAARETFKVEVTIVRVKFLTMETDTGMHTSIGTATKRGINTIIVIGTNKV